MENTSNFFQKLWSSKSIYHKKIEGLSFKKSSRFICSASSDNSKASSSSSFYPGRVQYGGAMSACRNCVSSVPYVIPQTVNLTNKAARAHSSKSNNTNDVFHKANTTPSSTAWRIFETLEKISLPLQNIRKVKKSNLKKCQSRQMLGLTNSMDAEDPKKLNSYSNNIILSQQIPLKLKQKTFSIAAPSAGTLKQESGSSESDVSSAIYRGQPAVIASLSSSRAVNLKRSADSASGGKIRSSRKTAAHYSTPLEKEDDVEGPSLADIATNISSLPKIDFVEPLRTSNPALPKTATIELIEQIDASPGQLYTFSPPAKILSWPKGSIVGSRSESLHASQTTTKTSKKKGKTIMKKGSKNPSGKSKLHKQRGKSLRQRSVPVIKCYASTYDPICDENTCPRALQSKGNIVETVITGEETSLPLGKDIFAKSKDVWECPVCLVENSNDLTKCAACKSPKPSMLPLNISDNSNEWTCNVCSVNNDLARNSCKACHTSRSDKTVVKHENVKAVDLPPWECDVCLVKNMGNIEKCKSCQTPKPGYKPLGKVKSDESAKWQCDTCLIFNDAKFEKCVACNTPRPGSKSLTLTNAFSVEDVSNNSGTYGSFTNRNIISFSSSRGRQSTASKNKKVPFGTSKRTSEVADISLNKLSSADNEQPTQLPETITGNKVMCATTASCSVNNDHSQMTCDACEAPEPAYQRSENKTKPIDLIPRNYPWECSVCLVHNDHNHSKCVACENPRVGSENDATKSQNESLFKFGNTSSSVFHFGIPSTERIKNASTATSHSPTIDTTAASSTLKSSLKMNTATLDHNKNSSMVSFLPSSISNALFSTSTLEFENTPVSSSDILVKGQNSGATFTAPSSSTVALSNLSSASGSSGFSAAKTDDNNFSSNGLIRQANIDENITPHSYGSFKLASSYAKPPTNLTPFSFSQPVFNPTTATQASGFHFQLPVAQTHQPSSSFSLSTTSTSSAFPSRPPSGTSTIISSNDSQEFVSTSGSSDQNISRFGGQKQNVTTTFGTKKTVSFADEKYVSPKPQFPFGNATNTSSHSTNSSGFGSSSSDPEQSQESMFSFNNSTNSTRDAATDAQSKIV